jgi:gluconokinase
VTGSILRRLAVAGLDIGTTATKAAVFDDRLNVIAAAHVHHPLLVEDPPRAEQDPLVLVDSALETLRDACTRAASFGVEVAAVSLSAAMHSLMGLDRSGRPITPVITWADNRSETQASALHRSSGALELYARTGTPIHPMSPLTKLMWFRENDSTTFDAVRKWVSIKEFFVSRMLGDYIVDHSVASATGLFDIRRRDWDDDALELAGLDRNQLSQPAPTLSTAGKLSADWAARLGINSGTPVVLGASDGVLENLGAGATSPEVAVITIGTSGAIRACVPSPVSEPAGRLFCYVLSDERWVVGGPINNGGLALTWLLENVLPDLVESNEPYGALDRLASDAPPGSDGVIFLPYLLGERAPWWDANTRAAFFGLSSHHDRPHLVRAVMEGVVHQLYQVHRVLTAAIGGVKVLRATGGFARSPVWRQIVADLFGLEVAFPAIEAPAACRGAAMLGMTAIGMVDSLETAAHRVDLELVHQPHERGLRRYSEDVRTFAELYEYAARASHR